VTPQITFLPMLPWVWLAALAVPVSLACALALARRAPGSLWRLTGFLLLFAILAGPHWRARTTIGLPDIAVLLVDHSQSMSINGRAAMAAATAAALSAQKSGIDLRIADVPPALAGGTDLSGSLHDAITAIPPAQLAGIIAITDGEVTPPASVPDVPFTALLTGQPHETDRELRLLAAPAYGLVGQSIALRLIVIDHGLNDAGTLVPVTITQDGAAIWQQQVPAGQAVAVTIAVHHAGPAVIAASAAALPGEVSLVNNMASFTLNGIHKQLSVLLISGTPNPGERSWRLLLKSDPAIQLVHFTILRSPGETIDADPDELALVPFPVAQLFESDINRFDLIILDRFDAAGLLPARYLANIATYVQNGGALLAEVGPEYATEDSLALTQLAPILPATPVPPGTTIAAFTPRLTPLGMRHPVTAPFVSTPLPLWYRMETVTATSGDVLMSGSNNAPLLILADEGRGRTGMLLSDQFWLWTKGGAHDGPALPLLRRIVHYLLREPALEPESLSAQIANGTLTINRQSLTTPNPLAVSVTAPDGQTRSLALQQSSAGTYTASQPAPDGAGVWKITDGKRTAFAAATATNAEEYQDLAATSSILGPIARNTIWLGQQAAPPLAAMIARRHARAVTSSRDIALLPPMPAMLLAIILLSAAWWRESR